MKWLSLTLIFCFFSPVLRAQENTDTTENKLDTNIYRWGNSKIIVINTAKENKKDKKWGNNEKKERWNHYQGIDLGFNGFANSVHSVDLPKDAEFMDLNYRKSITIAFNFLEFYIPIAHEKFGISTGLGLEFNNYDLDRDYSVVNVGDSTYGIEDATKSIKKNKFKTTSLNVPLLLETNLGKGAKNSFHLAIGGMGTYVAGSKTKQIFKQNGEEYKIKHRNDFNTNVFRLNAMVRAGYGSFTLFATYSLTPLFQNNRGPELYPFTFGISILSL